MKRNILLILSGFFFFSSTNSQVFKSANPFAHTFSIVARDPVTGEIGVAVQSHWFSVGTVVSWAEAGVGAVATQSFVNKSFGIRGLSLLKNGAYLFAPEKYERRSTYRHLISMFQNSNL